MNILNRVKGLAQNVAGTAIGEAKAVLTATPDDESEVELQLQRISDALMPDYRRDAMRQLAELLTDNPKAQLALGNTGIPVLVAVLTEDRDDLNLVRGALECLVLAMASTSSGLGVASAPDAANSGDQHTYHQQDRTTDPKAAATARGGSPQEAQAGAINAELFARKPEHVQLLLQLLEDEPVGINDFYVRYHTVQLLTLLLQTCAYKLQAAILASPMGVVRLMDMLSEGEVIRNEALLLLVALTRANEEVQKIAAFEGAFDRVFNMVREEGGSDGGVVVQDCLELLNNLLRGNLANQRLFREMGHISRLPHLLASAIPAEAMADEDKDSSNGADQGPGRAGLQLVQSLAGSTAARAVMAGAGAVAAAAAGASAALGAHGGGGGGGGVVISRQKATILLCALETVQLLVTPTEESAGAHQQGKAGGGEPTAGGQSPGAAAAAANQAALLSSGCLDALCKLCLAYGGVTSVVVRAQAIRALGDLILGSQKGQEQLGAATACIAKAAPELPVLLAVLRLTLHSPWPRERSSAEHVLRCFCTRNPDGQITLASTIAPMAATSSGNADDGSSSTFGGELVAALSLHSSNSSNSSLLISCRAASVLQYLLDSNTAAKQRLLTIPIELPPSPASPPELLMPRLMKLMSEALRVLSDGGCLAVVLLLRLLVTWLTDCPPAVASLLAHASHLPLLVDLAAGRLGGGDACTSGLAALALGVCLLSGTTSSASTSPGPPPSEIVLDVMLSRVGLSAFFVRLDELARAPDFVAAAAPPRLPRPLTRAAAAAAIGMDAGTRTSEAVNSSPQVTPFDYAFTQRVATLAEAIKSHAMGVFARPAAGSEQGTASTAADVVSSLPGTSESEKLGSAVEAIRSLKGQMAELQARNRALADDLFKVASGGTASVSLNQGAQPALTSGAASAADVEARVAAEMRASRAEVELHGLKSQLDALSARLSAAERAADEARAAASEAEAAAAKYETDLKGLSTAYNSLETHAFQLEGQVRDLNQRLSQQQQQQAPAVGGVAEAEVQRRIAEAVAQARAEAAAAVAGQDSVTGAAGVSVPEEEVQRRIDEAVQDLQAQVAEAEEQMTDLLVCLGQEEQKVALLSQHLAATGADVEALLATIKTEEEPEGEAQA